MGKRIIIPWATAAALLLSSGCPKQGDGASRDKAEWDRVATQKKYFASVVSPWAQGVKNPLGAALKAVPVKQRGAVIDLGTGIGNGVGLLARSFRRVVAIDYAPKMVTAARRRHAALRNVTFAVADMRDLGRYRGQFDVAVAVNSVLLPGERDVRKMLREAFGVLKPGGVLFGVFPSVESEAYIARVTFERELARLGDEGRAWQRTRELVGAKRIDFLRGVVSKSAVVQKFYFRFELVHRLRAAGFRNIRLGKVVYPWRMLDDPDARALDRHPGFWDWFVTARRPRLTPPRIAPRRR